MMFSYVCNLIFVKSVRLHLRIIDKKMSFLRDSGFVQVCHEQIRKDL